MIKAISPLSPPRISQSTVVRDDPPEEEEPPFENIGAAVFPSTQTTLPLFPVPDICAVFLRAAAHVRAKSTASTDIAAKTAPSKKPLEDLVPPEYLRYRKIFDEIASSRLPEHRPWDHAIELKPGAELKDCSLYRMPPDETTSLKANLEDLEKRGLIQKSKAPAASPVFFVEKKDGTKRFVQDYRSLNAITIKNAYPLPLIPDLIDKLRGARYFTKFDVRWGYNNIRI